MAGRPIVGGSGQTTIGERWGGGGFKWSGCIIRIRLWLRLPHGCHRPLSIVSASRASPGAFGLCIPALAPRCSPAPWTLQGYAYIQVSGHSLPEVL